MQVSLSASCTLFILENGKKKERARDCNLSRERRPGCELVTWSLFSSRAVRDPIGQSLAPVDIKLKWVTMTKAGPRPQEPAMLEGRS